VRVSSAKAKTAAKAPARRAASKRAAKPAPKAVAKVIATQTKAAVRARPAATAASARKKEIVRAAERPAPKPSLVAASKKPAPKLVTKPAPEKTAKVQPEKALKTVPQAEKPIPSASREQTVSKAQVSEPQADAPAPAPSPAVAPVPPPPEPPAPPIVEPTTEQPAFVENAAPVIARPGLPPGRHLPPRPMAKHEVFQEGDHVVYPTHGVGKVERIAIEEIAGHKLELIHITFEENRMTLRVPVTKARTAGLRKLATRKLFEEALAVLKGRARIKRTMWSRRAQEYEAKINSGDPLAIAEVVRDLHRNAGQPDQSFSERQIYEAAMDRLAAELAALDKTDKLTAATKLVDFLKTV